jgi:hypothetical protein
MPERMRNLYKEMSDAAKNLNLEINAKNDVDTSYRQFYLKNDRNAARAIIFLSCIVIAVFTFSDALFFDLSILFLVTVAIRIGIIICSLIVANQIASLDNFEIFDKMCLSLMIILGFGILAVYIAVPDSIISQLLIVDITVLTIYLVVPTRFTYQIIPASILSIPRKFHPEFLPQFLAFSLLISLELLSQFSCTLTVGKSFKITKPSKSLRGS